MKSKIIINQNNNLSDKYSLKIDNKLSSLGVQSND